MVFGIIFHLIFKCGGNELYRKTQYLVQKVLCHRWVTSITAGEALLCSGLLLAQVVSLTINLSLTSAGGLTGMPLELACMRALGNAAMLNLAIVTLPVSRTSLWLNLFGISLLALS